MSRKSKLATAFLFVCVLAAIPGCQNSTPPVTLTCRNSLVNRGLVLIVTNSSENHLSLWVHSKSNNSILGKKRTFSLSPGANHEIGWLEDFHLGNNSAVAIGGEGFGSKVVSLSDLPIHSK